jgi:hypothetical protein
MYIAYMFAQAFQGFASNAAHDIESTDVLTFEQWDFCRENTTGETVRAAEESHLVGRARRRVVLLVDIPAGNRFPLSWAAVAVKPGLWLPARIYIMNGTCYDRQTMGWMRGPGVEAGILPWKYPYLGCGLTALRTSGLSKSARVRDFGSLLPPGGISNKYQVVEIDKRRLRSVVEG